MEESGATTSSCKKKGLQATQLCPAVVLKKRIPSERHEITLWQFLLNGYFYSKLMSYYTVIRYISLLYSCKAAAQGVFAVVYTTLAVTTVTNRDPNQI